MVCSYEWFIPIKLFFPQLQIIYNFTHSPMGMSRINPTVIVQTNKTIGFVFATCFHFWWVNKIIVLVEPIDTSIWAIWVCLKIGYPTQMPTVKKGHIMRIHWILMSSQEKPLDAAQIESWGPNRSSKRFQARSSWEYPKGDV